MTFRHAAALALVGWYLMMPPLIYLPKGTRDAKGQKMPSGWMIYAGDAPIGHQGGLPEVSGPAIVQPKTPGPRSSSPTLEVAPQVLAPSLREPSPTREIPARVFWLLGRAG